MSKALELIRTLIDGANEYEKKTGNINPTVYLSRNNLLVIEQALLKAQEPKKYVDELKLVEKKLKSLDLLMQELDCKDFADLRKYARCGYEKLNNFKGSKEVKIEIPESSLMDYNPVKQYLKWEDLEFKEESQWLKVKMGNNFYRMNWCIDGVGSVVVSLYKYITNDYLVYCACIKDNSQQFFDDLHLERVE